MSPYSNELVYVSDYFNMSDNNRSNNTRKRTETVKEDDRQAAKSSALTPKITVDKPNRNVPSNVSSKNQTINETDHPVKVPIYYSTILVAAACVTITIIFSVRIFSNCF